MEIKVTLNGVERAITKQQLFAMAAKGMVGPETIIMVDSKPFLAGKVKDIVFGSEIEETIELPDDTSTPPVVNNTMATGNSFTSGVRENCINYGCGLTAFGFMICLFAGFLLVANLPLPIFYLMVGIGGFMLSAGPILFVIGLVIPEDPVTREQKHLRSQAEQGYSFAQIALTNTLAKDKALAELITGLFGNTSSPSSHVPSAVPLSPTNTINKLDTYFRNFWVGIAVGIPLCLILIGIPLLIAGIVFGIMLHYQLWKMIPTNIARTTPGKAVGFCFIPFFNFYWVFIAYKGLGEDMNKVLQHCGIQYKVNEGLGQAFCILFISTVSFNVNLFSERG